MSILNFWDRFKSIRGVVRMWHGDKFSIYGNRVRECEEARKNILIGEVPINPRVRVEFQYNKSNLPEELNRRELVKENMRRQKSRVQWLTEGNHNTS